MSNNRGGSREGSGRKLKYNEPTKTVRVPVSKIIEIKNYLNEAEKQSFNDVASITLVDPTTLMHIPLASEKVAAQAIQAADQEVLKARGELRAEAARLAVELAKGKLTSSIQSADHNRMVQEYLGKVGQL